jgi:hypothetical protein
MWHVPLRHPPIPRAAEPKGPHALRQRPCNTRPAGRELSALRTPRGGPCELQRLIGQPGLTCDDAWRGGGGAGTEGAAPTRLTILGAKTPLDTGMPGLVQALLPPQSDLALRTRHLLMLPSDGALVKAGGTCNVGLPARIQAGRTKQGDLLLRATADEQCRGDRGGIDQVRTRPQALL